jgi:hypothetical protein
MMRKGFLTTDCYLNELYFGQYWSESGIVKGWKSYDDSVGQRIEKV